MCKTKVKQVFANILSQKGWVICHISFPTAPQIHLGLERGDDSDGYANRLIQSFRWKGGLSHIEVWLTEHEELGLCEHVCTSRTICSDGEWRRYSNVVPSVTHVLGTVNGTKLLLKPNLYSGNCEWSNYSSEVPCLKVTGTVTKFLLKSDFPVPANSFFVHLPECKERRRPREWVTEWRTENWIFDRGRN